MLVTLVEMMIFLTMPVMTLLEDKLVPFRVKPTIAVETSFDSGKLASNSSWQ